MTASTDVGTWVAVCALADLQPERGVAALVGGMQVAIYRAHDDALYALDNRDPFSGAHVLSRGIVGSRGEIATVASPLFKHVFDLSTGRCLDVTSDLSDLAVRTFDVRCHDGRVEVRV